MRETLAEFVGELREIGIPVSMVETLDAAEALPYTDLSNRENLRATLGATLVKNPHHYPAFDVAFDVFFGDRPRLRTGSSAVDEGGSLSDDVLDALLEGDAESLRGLAGRAVEDHAGMQPGRPVGGRYYTYRVMRQLDADALMERLLAALMTEDGASAVDQRLAREQADRLLEQLREAVDSEVTSRLVDERGSSSVAASRRVQLLEDIDLMHATRMEIEEIERVVGPLAKKLATRLSQRRRRGRKGRLDVRRTIRASLGHGGVLVDPRFRSPRVAKPEVVILCDVSGSMATFARFTLQLTYAISSELSKVKVFAFIDGLDEVTGFFNHDVDFGEALVRLGSEADLVRRDGHSDYGRSMGEMVEQYRDVITPRTTLVITGDARNNYRPTGVEHLEELSRRARATYWLNPEPRRFWDTGDSVMSAYAPHCDVVEQVRTLRQLEEFVEVAALPAQRSTVGA